MSLFKQFYLLLFSALLIAFSLSYWFVIESSKDFLEKQMAIHSQDTATSLGISLGEAISLNDKAKIDTLLNAIFDNGYFAEIRVENNNGVILGKKTLNWGFVTKNIPDWFDDLISLNEQKADSEVTFNWKQVGTIDVVTHPGFAYLQLWEMAKRNFWALTGMLLLYLVVVSVINKKIEKPLTAVVSQAKSLMQQKFEKIDEIPSTPELNVLVTAMNTMVDATENYLKKLARDAQHWHEEAFIDALTSLPNRRDFHRHLQELSLTEADYYSISIGLVKITGVDGLNTRAGYLAGDELLVKIGKLLAATQQQEAGALIARLNGTEFAIVIRDFTIADIQPFYEQLSAELEKIVSDERWGCQSFIGAVVMQPGLEAEQYLTAADNVLLEALADSIALKIALKEDKILALGKEQQLETLWKAIKQQNVRLKSQAVVDVAEQQLIAKEYYLQVQVDDNTWIPAGRWLSRLKNYHEMAEIDKVVINRLFESPQQHAIQMVNVSPKSFADNESMVSWLINKYQSLIAATPLAVEFSQLLVTGNLKNIETWVSSLQQADILVGIDHFGFHADSLQWLTRIKPSYVKLDPAILSSLDESLENFTFIEALISLAHTLGIKVYATGVETEQLLTLAMQLNFDGYQGFAIEKPGFVSA